MLTLCPHCKTVFRVHPPQLASARGFVECGACDRLFNALDHLAEEPARSNESAVAPAPPASSMPAPTDAKQDASHGVTRFEDDEGTDDEGPRVGVADIDDVVMPEAEPPMPRIALVEPDSSPLLAHDDDYDDTPSVLREDLARMAAREGRRGRLAWGLLALLLLTGLAAQAAWYWRSDIIARFPQVLPYATRLCAQLGCRLEEPVGVDDIALVARDVRDHPQYAQTLLVNATLQNRGARTAKFPIIQLGVYDATGVAVGVRRFKPGEYLDQSIDVAAGMPAGGRIYIVLEIAGIGDRADSFEFSFL